jgi:hypothetical protein
MLSGEAKNIILIVFGLILSGLNPQSTAIKANHYTIDAVFFDSISI